MYRPDYRDWVDVTLPGPSDVVSQTEDVGCTLCPDGKFKSTVGDNSTHCLDCPQYSRSAADHRTCVCEEVVAAGTFKHFNVTLGTCQTLDDERAALITAAEWAVKVNPINSSLTRAYEYVLRSILFLSTLPPLYIYYRLRSLA